MDACLTSLLRFLRLSIVLTGLLQLAAFSATPPDTAYVTQLTLQQVPTQQLHAARPAYAVSIAAQVSVVSSGKVTSGNLPPSLSAEATTVIAPECAHCPLNSDYSRLLPEPLVSEQPRTRSPPRA